MWIWHFTKLTGFGYFLILAEFIVNARTLSDGHLCRVCICSEDDVSCTNLNDSRILLTYEGRDAFLLTISHSRLDLRQNYLKKFQNISSIIIESSELGNDFFGISDLREVMNLNLYNNSINKINSRMFSYNSKMINLYLENNIISYIDDGAFKHLNGLSTLVLSRNRLTCLQSNIFIGLSALEELDISCNKVRRVEINAFAPLSAIRKLNISHNLLENLEENMLSGLSSLEKLDLSCNHLHELSESDLSSLGSLKQLLLRDNQLEWLEADALARAGALEELDLSGNRLQRVEATALMPLRRLRVLRAGGNRLASLAPQLVALLAERPELATQLAPNPLRCTCDAHELRDAWEEAAVRGLRLDCTCASGQPWDAALRALRCEDDGRNNSSATVDAGASEEHIPPAFLSSESDSIIAESVNDVFNSSLNPQTIVIFTVTPSMLKINYSSTESTILSSDEAQLDESIFQKGSLKNFTGIIESASTMEEINLELTLVLLVCVVAIASTVAFGAVCILYLNLRKTVIPSFLSGERSRLISTNSTSSESTTSGHVL